MDVKSSSHTTDSRQSSLKTNEVSDFGSTNEDVKRNTSDNMGDQELELLMLTCKRPEAKGDVNLFEDMYQSWKNQEKQSAEAEKILHQKLKICEKEKDIAVRKVKDLEKNVQLLQTAVESLHNDLDIVDKFGKENMELKKEIKEHEETICKQREMFESKCDELVKKNKEVSSKYQKEIFDLREEMERKINAKAKDMDDLKTEKDQELEKLGKEMLLEKEKLKMEYENKLVKLQRHKATFSLNQQQSSSANHEIFRQKLQHLKKEHETEVITYKEQIRHLQEQLNASVSTQKGAVSNRQSFTTQPLFKKSRKF
ncbi:immunoglobulin G-binding protein H-like [Ruditapes philippinarum]|uniref:immunoglobulin G-binding protein H-like n=1 Tax=Ruditapes philippinarum TaxID=129788 RepID=UPI00295B4236|nr:immunoglobulin G-binding protein H-like [Ruditapes philippinarum]